MSEPELVMCQHATSRPSSRTGIRQAPGEGRPRRDRALQLIDESEAGKGRHHLVEVEVSVVVPAYKVEDYVGELLVSLRDQTLRELEILVVDDASPDRTASIVEAFARADSRVRLVGRPRNGGVCLARNQAIALASGRWIAFVDADDWLHPSRLAVLVQEGDRLRADWIADDQVIVEQRDAPPLGRVLLGEPAGSRCIDIVHLVERDPPERIGYGTLKPIVRRSFLVNSSVRFRPGLERYEDFVFHVELGLLGARMALVNQPLYFYRRHPGSLTARDPIASLLGMLKQNEVAAGLAAVHHAEAALAALAHRRSLIERALRYRSLLASLRRGEIGQAARRLRVRPSEGLNLVGGLGRAAWRRLRALA